MNSERTVPSSGGTDSTIARSFAQQFHVASRNHDLTAPVNRRDHRRFGQRQLRDHARFGLGAGFHRASISIAPTSRRTGAGAAR